MRLVFAALLIGLAPTLDVSAQVSPTFFTVSRGEIRDQRTVPATVEGKDNTTLRARSTGTVNKVLIARGQTVKKGQLLAIISDSNQSAQLAALQAALAASTARLGLAEEQAKRMESLLPSDAASKAEVEQAQAAFAGAKAEKASTESNLRMVQQGVENGYIRAPMNGKVSAMTLVSGSTVMPGDLLISFNTTPLRLILNVPERHATTLQPNEKITVTGFPDHETSEATVEEVFPSVQNGFSTVKAKMEGLETLPIGQKLTALIPTGTHQGIVVPTTFLTHQNGLTFATLKTGGKVVVQTGLPQPEGTVEILTGLNPGDILMQP